LQQQFASREKLRASASVANVVCNQGTRYRQGVTVIGSDLASIAAIRALPLEIAQPKGRQFKAFQGCFSQVISYTVEGECKLLDFA
jgi:hypothetical protein